MLGTEAEARVWDDRDAGVPAWLSAVLAVVFFAVIPLMVASVFT